MTSIDAIVRPDYPEPVLQKARAIQLVALDVDGVLTDGKLHFSDTGELFKAFNTLDGLGLKLLRDNNIKTVLITGRSSEIVKRRAAELGIDEIIQGREDKLQALQEVCQQHQMPLEQVAYMGDDLPDLSAIVAAGLGATVANAYPAVRQHADWQSHYQGGSGAVRELCDLLLVAKGNYIDSIKNYL